MAYKLAYNLLGLDHTVLPIVAKTYRKMIGVLQFYIKSDLNLDQHLEECIKNANPESYDNLQIFLFSASMGDLNLGGIIPWYQKEKINFTYIDSEMAFAVNQIYGQCLPELKNTLRKHNVPQHVFTSKFTLSYPSETVKKLKSVSEEKLNILWKDTLSEIESCIGVRPNISLGDKKIYITSILKDVTSILNVINAS